MSDEKRQALIRLSRQDVERLLRLPDGMEIIGVHDDWYMMGVQVLVEGPTLDPVPEGTEPPRLLGRWDYDNASRTARWSLAWEDGQ